MNEYSLKDSFRSVAPSIVLNSYRSAIDFYRSFHLKKRARQLQNSVNGDGDVAVYCDALSNFHEFSAWQKRSEILRLLEVVKKLEPVTVCEIGAASGGTSFLFTRVAAADATLISLDLVFPPSRKRAVQSFARQNQKVFCLNADSHRQKTLDAVKACLRERPLDLLFIDGDHSYEGVSTDFKLYSPLVRKGGVIVFHDIVEDYSTRHGINTPNYAGGVPQFWNEIKRQYKQIEEVIEDPEQDGYGIGILHWE